MVFCIITGYNVLAWSNFLAYTKNINYKRLYYFKTILRIIMFICLNWMIRIIKFPYYSWYKPIKKNNWIRFSQKKQSCSCNISFYCDTCFIQPLHFQKNLSVLWFFLLFAHLCRSYYFRLSLFMTKPGLSRTN